MHAADFFRAVEIGERARHAQYAMIATRGEPHGVGGVAQQRHSTRIGSRHILQDCAGYRRIAANVRQADRGIAGDLPFAGERDALGDFAAAVIATA